MFSHRLDLDLLAESLAATLQRFPLFAGRVRSSKSGYYEGIFSGQGASLACAASSLRLVDVLPAGMVSSMTGGATTNAVSLEPIPPFHPPDLTQLCPDAPRTILGYLGKDVPVLHAKVTHFVDGGSCLAVAVPHLLGDQDTCKTLLAAWAAEYTAREKTPTVSNTPENPGGACPRCSTEPSKPKDLAPTEKASDEGAHAGKLAAELLPSYAASTLPDAYVSPNFEERTFGFIPKLVGSAIWHVAVTGGITTVTYHVPAARLAELKAEATRGLQLGGSTTQPGWVSTNDALVARVWQALAQLPPKADSSLFLSINLRKRLRPALPDATLGNCAWSVAVGRSGLRPGEASLGDIAAAVRAAIQGIDLQQVSQDLKWVEDHLGTTKAMPVVIRGAANLLPESGSVVLSHWDWDKDYKSVSFGAPPVWHQSMEPRTPNCVFVMPAPPGVKGRGSLVFLTLHKRMAAALATKVPAL